MAINFNNVTDIMLGQNQVTQIEDSLGNVLWSATPADEYFYVEDISGADNTLSIVKREDSAPTIEVFCSTDKQTWTSMGTTSTTPITATIPADGKLYLKCTANSWSAEPASPTENIMSASGTHNVGGSVMSLLRGDNYVGATLTNNERLSDLFLWDDFLISAGDLYLPPNTVDDCFRGMFFGCSNLTTPPVLPAKRMYWQCYRCMFFNCTSLTTAPALPAETLADSCYLEMFNGCTSLTEAPVLPATTLAASCYQVMFQGCSNLNSVTTYAQDISASSCLSDWLNSVAATGDFYNLGGATYTADSASGIPAGWIERTSIPDYFYVEDISGADNTLSIVKREDSAPTIEVFCSTDKQTWTSMGITSTTAITATVPANGKLYLKAVCDRWGNDAKYNTISASGNHNVGGNIMSLLYGDNYQNQTTFPDNNAYVFPFLFYRNTGLKNAVDLKLPALTLRDSCYKNMFYGCSSLTTAPALPATTLAQECYSTMYSHCTSLTQAPALPATNLTNNCYSGMFFGCTHLTTAPALPATILASRCYDSMLFGCSSLTTAPALPATTLAQECYSGMFYDCTSLTSAPALPATNLAKYCYRHMFYGCTSLTTAPALPATTMAVYCYGNMFQGCTHLTSVITYADNISAINCLSYWLSGVAATGDFYNLGGATYKSGASGIPAGWIERTALPEYFYLENVSNDTATVSFKAGNDTTINIKVSTDKSNWVDLGLITNAPTYSLPAGDKLYISATGDTWNFATIKCNKSFNIGGYIMSLLKGDNFSANNHFSNERTTQFGGIFGDNNTLISANNLILATNTDYHCYQWMFAGCTSLTASPVLSAPRLVDSCYSYMFYGCTSLNTVTTYAKDSTGGCNNWLNGVAATGDFYNLGGATYESGADGIPSGWTEHTSL